MLCTFTFQASVFRLDAKNPSHVIFKKIGTELTHNMLPVPRLQHSDSHIIVISGLKTTSILCQLTLYVKHSFIFMYLFF